MLSQHEKYHGLPVMLGKAKTTTFKGVKEKMVKRLQGWKELLGRI